MKPETILAIAGVVIMILLSIYLNKEHTAIRREFREFCHSKGGTMIQMDNRYKCFKIEEI